MKKALVENSLEVETTKPVMKRGHEQEMKLKPEAEACACEDVVRGNCPIPALAKNLEMSGFGQECLLCKSFAFLDW
jgi:hypothetical protein